MLPINPDAQESPQEHQLSQVIGVMVSDQQGFSEDRLSAAVGNPGIEIVVEPSAVVPLAVLLEQKVNLAGRKVGIILSGGNVDLEACLSHSLDDA